MGSAQKSSKMVLCLVLIFTMWSAVLCRPESETKLSESVNSFTFDLYKVLSKEKGNLICSPFSLDVVASMLALGAKGSTAKELVDALKYGSLSMEDVKTTFKSKMDKLKRSGNNTLTLANSFWVQKDYPVKQSYKNDIELNFKAEVTNVDFRGNPQKATSDINDWANDETRGLIQKIFDTDLPPNTVFVLANAMYFKGQWEIEFKKVLTKDGKFRNDDSDDSPSSVKLMHQQAEFGYYMDPTLNAQVLQMYYSGKDMVMDVILPAEGSNMAALEMNLNWETLKNAVKSVSTATVDVTLPRFEMQSTFDLVQPMKDLGMKKIFDSSADLSGIAPGVVISEAIQKAAIKVNEEGSEAAVVTAVVAVESYAPEPPEIITFRADHPFVFLIRDLRTNMILFIGRVISLPTS